MSFATRLKRSVSFSFVLVRLPLPLRPIAVLSVKFVVSTTSVEPSKRPRASPRYSRIFPLTCGAGPSGMMRVSFTISYLIAT